MDNSTDTIQSTQPGSTTTTPHGFEVNMLQTTFTTLGIALISSLIMHYGFKKGNGATIGAFFIGGVIGFVADAIIQKKSAQ